MSTHNICFHGEIRKISVLFSKKKQQQNTLSGAVNTIMGTIASVPMSNCKRAYLV